MRRIAVVVFLIGLLVPTYKVTLEPGCQAPGALFGTAEGYSTPGSEVTSEDVCTSFDHHRLLGALIFMLVAGAAASVLWTMAPRADL